MATQERIVPVAYVTKWATTRGIVVIRDAEVTTYGALSRGAYLYIPAGDWTEDRTIAEGRWRKAMQKAADAAQKKADRLRAAVTLPPKYDDTAGA